MLLFIVLLFSGSAISSVLDSMYGSFSSPPMAGNASAFSADVTWVLGSTQTIQWRTALKAYNISLWQQDLMGHGATSGPSIFAKSSTNVETGQFVWIVQIYGFDLAQGNVFYFAVNTADSANYAFTSHYFNISKDLPSTALTGASTTTSISGGATATPSRTPPKSSAGTKAGLGAGLGLGIPVVALLCFGTWRRFYNRKRHATSPDSHPQELGGTEMQHSELPSHEQEWQAKDLNGQPSFIARSPIELPGSEGFHGSHVSHVGPL